MLFTNIYHEVPQSFQRGGVFIFIQVNLPPSRLNDASILLVWTKEMDTGGVFSSKSQGDPKGGGGGRGGGRRGYFVQYGTQCSTFWFFLWLQLQHSKHLQRLPVAPLTTHQGHRTFNFRRRIFCIHLFSLCLSLPLSPYLSHSFSFSLSTFFFFFSFSFSR